MLPSSRAARAAFASLLLALAASALATFAAPAFAQDRVDPHVAQRGVDPYVAPGDDFFRYANGEWLHATKIPPGMSRWGARNEIAERTADQVSRVIREANAAGATSYERNVANFHAAFLDEAAIEKEGLASVAPLLASIDRLHDKAALARWLGAHLRADVDPLNVGIYDSPNLFGLAVEAGIHGEARYIAYLTQGGLGLGDRDAYLDDAAAKREARARYRDYIASLLDRAEFDRARWRADAVLALETAIARVHANAADSGNDANADHHWRRVEFAKRAPGMDWPAFFAAAGLSKEDDIVAWQPGAITGTAALVASQPLAVWRDYLRFHALDRYADVLPHAIAHPAREFRASLGAPAVPRERRAIDATNQALPEAVGRLYVQRYFTPADKARVKSILDHVVAALQRRVAAVPWMGGPTKAVALSKLKAMRFGVGYPDRWRDDSALTIDAHDALGNLRRIDEWSYRDALAKLGRDVDRDEWIIAPQMPGAILDFHRNAYNFAAALLQPPKFDPAASDAAAYGAIGAIFGHEASHIVDTLGADYDERGAARNWWSAEDKARYEAVTRPLVDQFAAYRPFPDAAIDGKRTLVENMADLGGLAAAFDAYREVAGPRAVSRDELRRWDREFFIAFARSWRAMLTDEAMRAQLKSDIHAPEAWRIATVRNLDAWYEAFDVQPGQRLYLAPGARVHPW